MNSHQHAGTVLKSSYNNLIKNLNIWSIPFSESEEYDI